MICTWTVLYIASDFRQVTKQLGKIILGIFYAKMGKCLQHLYLNASVILQCSRIGPCIPIALSAQSLEKLLTNSMKFLSDQQVLLDGLFYGIYFILFFYTLNLVSPLSKLESFGAIFTRRNCSVTLFRSFLICFILL